MVWGPQPQLRLYDSPNQGAVPHAQETPDPLNAVFWATEALHEPAGETYVVEPEAPQGIEAEYVPRDAAQDVGHVPALEEAYRVGHLHLVPLDAEDPRLQLSDVRLLGRQLGPGSYRALRRHPASRYIERDTDRFDMEGAYEILVLRLVLQIHEIYVPHLRTHLVCGVTLL